MLKISTIKSSRLAVRFTAIAILLLGLSACGSTKVYTADKTITYRGSLYNMGSVKKLSSRIEGELPDGSSRDMTGMEKGQVKDILDEHDEIVVSTFVVMDDSDMLYERKKVDSWGDFDDLADDLEDAMEDINDFMGDKKDTQLELD